MTLLIQKSSRFMILALMVVVMAMGAGCKSKKKAMEAQQAAEKARIEQEAAARKQREEEEARRRREADEQARRDAEARARAEREVVGPQKKLEQYFSAIANATSPGAANNSINEALALFASPSTPVLIVIHEEGGEKDYDRPTNIKDYLNYLKDQKKQADRIGNLQFDGSGKIKEVELVKQK